VGSRPTGPASSSQPGRCGGCPGRNGRQREQPGGGEPLRPRVGAHDRRADAHVDHRSRQEADGGARHVRHNTNAAQASGIADHRKRWRRHHPRGQHCSQAVPAEQVVHTSQSVLGETRDQPPAQPTTCVEARQGANEAADEDEGQPLCHAEEGAGEHGQGRPRCREEERRRQCGRRGEPAHRTWPWKPTANGFHRRDVDGHGDERSGDDEHAGRCPSTPPARQPRLPIPALRDRRVVRHVGSLIHSMRRLPRPVISDSGHPWRRRTQPATGWD